jgi:membrane-associated phospholipid phosphatase
MPLRPAAVFERILPRGWADLLRQIMLFCGAYWLYRLVRGQVDGRAAQAFENAQHIVHLEKALGLFVEPAVNSWAEANEWVADIASWLYVNSHFTITTVTLAFLYLRRNDRFYFVRNMFLVAMGIALVGYLVFPTAPPRFLPGLGFEDSVAQFTGVDTQSSNVLFNPFAAVPSMHVAFALMLGLSMASIVRHTWARALWSAYPLLVTFVVIATANHWWFDGFTGALAAAASALAARELFARARPDAWAWDTSPGAARA